ncbi:MAG: thiolase domain-containing protein [Nitrospirota bacterium]|nr:thiolase domain-containing protein [Nitrospirota bacterium]
MRPVYLIAGGVTKFARAYPDKDCTRLVQEAFDMAMGQVPNLDRSRINGSVGSYFSEQMLGRLMACSAVHDALGLCPTPSRRVEGGGASGGLCLQSAWEAVASGRMEVCLAFGFEVMSKVGGRKANDIIALASDPVSEVSVGGFFSAYYAMMARRHMHQFGTTREQMAMVAVKNHANAVHNPFAQAPMRLGVEEVKGSAMIADPITLRDTCLVSDGAAVVLLASEEAAMRYCKRPVRISGVGSATDTARLGDRPRGEVPLLPHESETDYRGLEYPGIHSCRAGRLAAREAYRMAGVSDPSKELDFVELYDAYTSAEIQACEALGLCRIGHGGRFVESGAPFMKGVDYGLQLSEQGNMPVNPSGGLLACGHAIGATGLMQTVFALWQLQGSIGEHLGDATLQVPEAKRGLVHTHGGTGTCVTVTVLERA